MKNPGLVNTKPRVKGRPVPRPPIIKRLPRFGTGTTKQSPNKMIPIQVQSKQVEDNVATKAMRQRLVSGNTNPQAKFNRTSGEEARKTAKEVSPGARKAVGRRAMKQPGGLHGAMNRVLRKKLGART